jgi:hypothetical protein
MRPPQPKPKKLIPGPNFGAFSKALEKPKVVKPTGAVKKTSRPGVAAGAPKKATGTPRKITITGSATGSRQLTAAQVARFNKLTSKTNMRNR